MEKWKYKNTINVFWWENVHNEIYDFWDFFRKLLEQYMNLNRNIQFVSLKQLRYLRDLTSFLLGTNYKLDKVTGWSKKDLLSEKTIFFQVIPA